MIARWDRRFAQKVFTQREIDLCASKPNFAHSIAARWAAKEAFSKALGTGWDTAFRWKEIEILTDPKGKPVMLLSGNMQKAVAGAYVHVSLSHSNENAIAVVIIEEQESFSTNNRR